MKRAKWNFCLILLLCSLLPFSVFAEGQGEEEREDQKEEQVTIDISSGSLGGSWYPFAATVGENILKPAGFDYTNSPGGGTSNVVAVSSGKADIGLTMTTSIGMAETASGPFEKEYENVVAIAALFPDPLHIMVPKKSNIQSIEDLKGKTIGSASEGQLAATVTLDVLKAYGISVDEVTLQKGSPADHAPLYKDGHIDAWMYIMPPPSPQASDMAHSRPSRMLSIDQEHFEKLNEMRSGYSLYELPTDMYPGVESATLLNTFVVWCASEDMDDDVAYKMAKAFVENKEEFGKGLAIMKGVTAEDLANIPPTVRIHPGALRYYEEIGVK